MNQPSNTLPALVNESKKFKDLKLSPKESSVLKMMWKFTMNFFGVTLICFFGVLYYVIFYSFIYDTCLIYFAAFRSQSLTIFIMTIGIWLGFNLVFQFVLAVIVSPGYTSDLFKKVQADSSLKEGCNPFIYDPSKSQYNKSMIYVKIENTTLGFCNKCNLPKPQRTHHCSVCDKCVLKMDHHCPWINGCVGYQNHRHFALFLFYVFSSTLYVTILNLPFFMTSKFSEYFILRTDWYQLTMPLNAVLSITILLFGSWSWYLIMKGQTTIEFWSLKKRDNNKIIRQNNTILNNLRVVFGEVNNFWQITFPSFRDLQSNGIIWNIQEDEKSNQEDEEQIKDLSDSQLNINIKEEEQNQLL